MSTKKETYNDDDILKGIKLQDYKILQVVYDNYYQTIERYIINNGGRSDDARDIFQEVVIVLYRKVKDDSIRLTAALQNYLFSIGRLMWLKELEKRHKQGSQQDLFESLLSTDEEAELTTNIEYNARLKLFREKFEELTTNCKRVLRLFLNGLSIKEITEIMGYTSIQHTKNRRYRCKEKLIKTIKEDSRYTKLCYGKSKVH